MTFPKPDAVPMSRDQICLFTVDFDNSRWKAYVDEYEPWGWNNFQEFSFAAMDRITCQDLQNHTAPKVIQVFVGLRVSYSDSLLLWFAFWEFMHTYWPSQCTKINQSNLPWQQWYNYIQRSQHFRNSKKASTRFWQISEILKNIPKKLLGSVAEFRYEYYILGPTHNMVI